MVYFNRRRGPFHDLSLLLPSFPPSLPSFLHHRALWVAPVDFLVMIFTFLVTVLYNVEKVCSTPPPPLPPLSPISSSLSHLLLPLSLPPSLPPPLLLPQGLEYGIIASVVILLLQISKLDMDSIGQLRMADDEVQMLVDPKAGTDSPCLPPSLLSPSLPPSLAADSGRLLPSWKHTQV